MNAMDFVLLILIGAATGMLGTLVGAGGGFILMPILLLLYPSMKVESITMISMAVIFFNSLSGTVAYSLMKRVDYRTGLMFAAATLPGAVLGTFATKHINRSSFNFIFGVFLMGASLLLMFLRKNNENDAVRDGRFDLKCEIRDKWGKAFCYSYNLLWGIGISIFTGFVSPILGIGGGIIHVPAMIRILGFPAHIATATSHFTLMIMSAASVITHLLSSPDFSVMPMALILSAGAVAGAQVGAGLSKKANEKLIVTVLSVALFAVGIRILLLGR